MKMKLQMNFSHIICVNTEAVISSQHIGCAIGYIIFFNPLGINIKDKAFSLEIKKVNSVMG